MNKEELAKQKYPDCISEEDQLSMQMLRGVFIAGWEAKEASLEEVKAWVRVSIVTVALRPYNYLVIAPEWEELPFYAQLDSNGIWSDGPNDITGMVTHILQEQTLLTTK